LGGERENDRQEIKFEWGHFTWFKQVVACKDAARLGLFYVGREGNGNASVYYFLLFINK